MKSLAMCVAMMLIGGYAFQGREQEVLEAQEFRVVKNGKTHVTMKAAGDGAEFVLFADGEPEVRILTGKETTLEVMRHGSEAKWMVACSGDLVEAGATTLQPDIAAMARLEKTNGRWNAAMRCQGKQASVGQSCDTAGAVMDIIGPHRAIASLLCNEDGDLKFTMSSDVKVRAAAYCDRASVEAELGNMMGGGQGMTATASIGSEDKQWSWRQK